MIKFGVAGIPLSCKWRTLKEGVTFVKQLGLDAMEIRVFKDLAMDNEELREVGETAKFHGVTLSVHAPYYIDFGEEERERSIEKIENCGLIAKLLDANLVVTHAGFYNEESYSSSVEALKTISSFLSKNGIKARIGIETTGKKNTIGSLGEVVDMCKKIKNTIPVIDFAHIHARNRGSLNSPEAFAAVFDALKPLNLKSYYIHFSGIHFDESGERYYLPIKKDTPKFEHLAIVLVKKDLDAKIICESPVLEHDAAYMKIILERVQEKLANPRTRAG
jgi:deoxyribonuclease-4